MLLASSRGVGSSEPELQEANVCVCSVSPLGHSIAPVFLHARSPGCSAVGAPGALLAPSDTSLASALNTIGEQQGGVRERRRNGPSAQPGCVAAEPYMVCGGCDAWSRDNDDVCAT